MASGLRQGPAVASRLRLTLVLSSVVLVGCGAPADLRAKVALFQQRISDGQLAAVQREWRTAHKNAPPNFEYDTGVRAKLGRMIRTTTTEAFVSSGTKYAELVTFYQNTEFEGGHALETFTFRVDGAEPQLEAYGINLGMRISCPMIAISMASCSTDRVPDMRASR